MCIPRGKLNTLFSTLIFKFLAYHATLTLKPSDIPGFEEDQAATLENMATTVDQLQAQLIQAQQVDDFEQHLQQHIQTFIDEEHLFDVDPYSGETWNIVWMEFN